MSILSVAIGSIPAATLSPCPRDPVATSMKLSLGVGWPSRSEFNLRRFNRSLTGKRPASAQLAYRMGAAWPLPASNHILQLVSIDQLMVSLTQNKSIIWGAFGLFDWISHCVEEKDRHYFGHRCARSRVTEKCKYYVNRSAMSSVSCVWAILHAQGMSSLISLF